MGFDPDARREYSTIAGINMTFRQLTAFKAIFELGTTIAAAEHLYMTQPAVSKLLAALEHRVGFPLFARIRGRLIPTSQGSAFYNEVQRTFNSLDNLEKSARDIRTQNTGKIRIATAPLFANSFLPEIVSQLLSERPDTAISLQAYRSDEVARLAGIQACDLGLVGEIADVAGTTALTLRTRCVCILHVGSELRHKAAISATDLIKERFVRHEDDRSQRALDNICALAGVVRQDVIETSFAYSVASLVAHGAGIAIVDPFTADQALKLNDTVVVKPFEPTIEFEFQFLLPTYRPTNPLAYTLLMLFLSQARLRGIELAADRDPVEFKPSDFNAIP